MRSDSIRYLPALLLILACCSFAQSEIHRCTQEDGTVAFQQMPCEEGTDAFVNDAADAEPDDVDKADSGDDALDFSSPFDAAADPPATSQSDTPVSISSDRATCEKLARDAIDAIDLEMRKSSAQDERQHLDELLTLTRELRECKRL